MSNIRRFLKLIFILTLFMIPLLQSDFVKEIEASDNLLTVTGGKAYVDYTTVYEDFFLVFNGTTILKYDLEDLVLLDSIVLGGSVAPTETLLKYDEWYLEYNDGGVVTYAVLDIPNFVIKDTQITTKFPNFTGDLMSLAYIEDSTVDYWCYIWAYKGTGTGAVEGLSSFVFPFWDSTKTYRRFGGMGNVGFNGHPVTCYVQFYVYNSSADSTTGYIKVLSSDGANTYLSVAYATRTGLDGTEDSYQEYKYYSGNNHYYMGITSKQLKMNIDYSLKSVSATYGVLGLRDDTYTVTHGLADSVGEIYIWLDSPTTWYKMRDSDINNIDISAFTKGSFGGKTSYTLNYNSHIATQRSGLVAVERYVDILGLESSYIAYIDTNHDIIAEKIVGLNIITIDIYSVTPATINVYSSLRNFIGVYTLGATNDLYVYNAILPDSEIGGYANTLLVQLFRAYSQSDSFLHYVKFMLNNSYYTPCANEPYDFYEDNIYISSGTLDANGIMGRSYYHANLPKTLSYFVNKSGYIAKWFNITLYSIEPLYIDVTEKETPILSLNIYPLNLTDNLRIELSIDRYTGEALTSYYWVNNPKISIQVETFGLNNYYHVYTVSPYEVYNGFAPSTFVYTKPYNYRVTYSFTNTSQSGFIRNVTNTASILFTYDSINDIVTIGGYVSIPTVDTSPDAFPTDTGILTSGLIFSMVTFLPTMLVILIPVLALLSLAVGLKAPAGVFMIMLIIGLNIGVGVAVWSQLAPLYFMLVTILLDALSFVFLLKMGGSGGI